MAMTNKHPVVRMDGKNTLAFGLARDGTLRKVMACRCECSERCSMCFGKGKYVVDGRGNPTGERPEDYEK